LYLQIPIVCPTEAAELAVKYARLGFQTLKLKVGKDLNRDIDVLKAIRNSHPTCSFILDANEGYTASEAIEVLKQLHGIVIVALNCIYFLFLEIENTLFLINLSN
jgi:L-alanine-DL-glutamate epimerase-like enolase superfamily enzyme